MQFFKVTRLLLLGIALNSCNHSNDRGAIVEQTYVHRYGVAVPEPDWTLSGETGKVITTLKNGVVVSKSLVSGVLEGETTYSFPHSEVIEKVETYKDGQLKKTVIHYYSGKPALEIVYLDENDRLYTKWYENGSPLCKEKTSYGKLISGEYFSTKNQIEGKVSDGEGNRIQRDQYGQYVSNDTIKDGEMVLCTTYHTNGTPKALTPYKNGVIEGQLKTYFPAGEPNTIENYVDGKKQGITVVYQNGEKYAEVPYVDDYKHGIERRYRDGKQVVEEISWVNGQRHGPSYSYVGDVTKTDWYYQDRHVTEKAFDLLNRGKPLQP